MAATMLSQLAKGLICGAGLAPLPTVEVESLATDAARIWIKREWDDPYGPDPLRTHKRKPACLLIADAVEKSYLRPGKIAIATTSGNLGIEIGLIAAHEGFRFISVVPGEIPLQSLEIMLELGVDVIQTSETANCPREATVLFTRGSATEFHHRLTNVEQYNSWLNPLAHTVTTAPELFETFDQRVDYAITPVGSCGTICGLHHYLVTADQQAELVGVQPAVGQGIPGTNVVAGDVAWSPENYSPIVLPADHIFTVDEVDAYAFTAKLWACGIPAGPSTGMALARACELVRDGATGNLVVISPDSNFKYGDLIRDSLRELKGDIVARHPELELDDSIEAYVEEMKESSGLGHTLQRIRQCYPSGIRGQLYREHDIHDIVWATDRARRARRNRAERYRVGLP